MKVWLLTRQKSVFSDHGAASGAGEGGFRVKCPESYLPGLMAQTPLVLLCVTSVPVK